MNSGQVLTYFIMSYNNTSKKKNRKVLPKRKSSTFFCRNITILLWPLKINVSPRAKTTDYATYILCTKTLSDFISITYRIHISHCYPHIYSCERDVRSLMVSPSGNGTYIVFYHFCERGILCYVFENLLGNGISVPYCSTCCGISNLFIYRAQHSISKIQ